MRQFSSILCIGALAFIIAACGEVEETAESPAASPVASPAAPTTAAPPATPAPTVPFKEPTVPEQPVVATVGLIQSTNPDVRAAQAAKGRTDPFGGIKVAPTVDPTVKIPKPVTVKKTVPTVGGVPGQATRTAPTVGAVPQVRAGGANPPTSTNPTGQNPGTRTNPGSRTTSPGTPGGTQSTPLPGGVTVQTPLPEPDVARAVNVTGVVAIGGQAQAIVKAPDEPTSRSVRVGQRLSNGQVLVKRIEMNEGAEPIVILEQYGIEVAKTIEPQSGSETKPAS